MLEVRPSEGEPTQAQVEDAKLTLDRIVRREEVSESAIKRLAQVRLALIERWLSERPRDDDTA